MLTVTPTAPGDHLDYLNTNVFRPSYFEKLPGIPSVVGIGVDGRADGEHDGVEIEPV